MELWREEYRNDAYVDQAGVEQPGHVVYEIIEVTEIGREDKFEYYGRKLYEDKNIIAVSKDNRLFYGIANLVDYHGSMWWKEIKPGQLISEEKKMKYRKTLPQNQNDAWIGDEIKYEEVENTGAGNWKHKPINMRGWVNNLGEPMSDEVVQARMRNDKKEETHEQLHF